MDDPILKLINKSNVQKNNNFIPEQAFNNII